MTRVWLFVLLLLALTACSELQPYKSTWHAPVVTWGYGTGQWLGELHNTREMTPDEIRQTVKAWEQELRDDPRDSNRIKLALLLTVGDAPARNPKRARELLEGLDEATVNTSDQELVTILLQILDEQDHASLAISRLRKQAGKQGRRIRELEQQQRALTDIEQNIQQRNFQPDIEHGNQ